MTTLHFRIMRPQYEKFSTLIAVKKVLQSALHSVSIQGDILTVTTNDTMTDEQPLLLTMVLRGLEVVPME